MRLFFKLWGSAALIIFTLWSAPTFSHNPNISLYTIAGKQGEWQLKIDTMLYNLHQALLTQYSEKQLVLDKGEYNADAANDYFINHIELRFNQSKPVVLKAVSHTISDHQSVFIFSLEGVPEQIESALIKVNALEQNPAQANIVRLTVNGMRKKALLNQKNHFEQRLVFIQ